MNQDRKEIIDKMCEFQSELLSEDIQFDENSLSALVLEACEFAYNNYQMPDDFYDGYEHQFEVEISTVGLRLMSGLQEVYPHLRKSTLLINTIFDILNTSKYASGRDGFILVLWQNKLDKEFIQAIQTHPEFWNDGRIFFNIVWGLTRRRIRGYSDAISKALEIFTDKRADSEIIKKCKKYLEDEHKYKKHYSEF